MFVICMWWLMLTVVVRLSSASSRQQTSNLPTPDDLLEYREQIREMFYHGFDNYMNFGFPFDELDPIKCTGKGRDYSNPQNTQINDVLGDYYLTLIDSLDTLMIMGDRERFIQGVQTLIRNLADFHVETTVQLFESNIRILGGLLSAHLLALKHYPEYQGELLDLSYDLAQRYLPAFNYSNTGIPHPRINLKYGLIGGESFETCTAGAGTLILEFGVLSRLTNDSRFEMLAKQSIRELWKRRSNLNMVGNVINVMTGRWSQPESSIGAGIDSFFEYLFKAYILLGDEEYLDMFQEAYEAILRHMRDENGVLYRVVHMDTGQPLANWVDSLGAYFPGLQALYGDLENSLRLYELYFGIWRKYGSLPERWDFRKRTVELGHYPLRPEMAESTYFLYRATKDDYFLQSGQRIMQDLQKHTRTSCGFASIKNVHSKAKEDRMESFFLSETLKYLYLLFDVDNSIHQDISNYVFSTEGHLLYIPNQAMGKYHYRDKSQLTCKRFVSPNSLKLIRSEKWRSIPPPLSPEDQYRVQSVLDPEGKEPNHYSSSSDTQIAKCPAVNSKKTSRQINHIYVDYATITNADQPAGRITRCETDILLTSINRILFETSSTDGQINNNIVSLNNLPVISESDGLVFIKQDSIEIFNGDQHFLTEHSPLALRILEGHQGYKNFYGSSSDFAADNFLYLPRSAVKYPMQGLIDFLPTNLYGCRPYDHWERIFAKDKLLLVGRGNCEFMEKAYHATIAGAAAIIITNHQESVLHMGISADFKMRPGTLALIPTMMISLSQSKTLLKIIEEREREGLVPLYGAIAPLYWMPIFRDYLRGERTFMVLNGIAVKNLAVLTRMEFEALQEECKLGSEKIKDDMKRLQRIHRILPYGSTMFCTFNCRLQPNKCCM